MELRHLRYFVAVAEARSLKLAAEEKLNTTQPSLSRQIRDLEDEVGTPLFVRGAKGVELTPAGRVFLDHARVMLSQAEAAVRISSPNCLSYRAIPLTRLHDRPRYDLASRSTEVDPR